MQGHFDLYLLNSGRLTDEDFAQARREGHLNSLLEGLPIDEEVHCSNQVTHMFTIALFRKAFGHGFPDGAYPMERGVGVVLHNITLAYDATQPAYTDWWGGYNTIHNTPYSVNTGNAGKRFIGYDIERHQDVDPNGREGVFTWHRWLYSPSQVVSNQIRTVNVFWCETVRDGIEEKGYVARVRLKDAGGNPVTLNKSASQTLLIQYTFTLVAL